MLRSVPKSLTVFCLFVATLVGIAAEAWAQGSYRIRPGDVLAIEVLEDANLNREVLVLPDGTISFPQVGIVTVAGSTVADVRRFLTSGLASNFAVEPNVYVSLNSLAEVPEPPPPPPPGPTIVAPPPEPVTIDTYVVGEVASPGKFDVEPGTTILQLLAQAGGPTKFAAETRIELRRTVSKYGDVRVYLYSYTGRGKGARVPSSTMLAPGDVIVVPQRRLFE